MKIDFNFNLAFKTINKLSKQIKNNKSKTDILQESGVYKLNCTDCNKVYIGQTGRSFETRIKEHRDDFVRNLKKKKKDPKSNYAKHLLENCHNFNQECKILHVQEKSFKLNALESLGINRLRNTNLLLNDQLDLNDSLLLNLFTNFS